jgi:hypothetical protein
MTETLKPCPFCGARPLRQRLNAGLWWISCTLCEAEQSHGTETGVVGMWNRRVTEATDPLEPGLTGSEKRAQAFRCACRGVDDMCACQNVPDAVTRKARAVDARPCSRPDGCVCGGDTVEVRAGCSWKVNP